MILLLFSVLLIASTELDLGLITFVFVMCTVYMMHVARTITIQAHKRAQQPKIAYSVYTVVALTHAQVSFQRQLIISVPFFKIRIIQGSTLLVIDLLIDFIRQTSNIQQYKE